MSSWHYMIVIAGWQLEARKEKGQLVLISFEFKILILRALSCYFPSFFIALISSSNGARIHAVVCASSYSTPMDEPVNKAPNQHGRFTPGDTYEYLQDSCMISAWIKNTSMLKIHRCSTTSYAPYRPLYMPHYTASPESSIVPLHPSLYLKNTNTFKQRAADRGGTFVLGS